MNKSLISKVMLIMLLVMTIFQVGTVVATELGFQPLGVVAYADGGKASDNRKIPKVTIENGEIAFSEGPMKDMQEGKDSESVWATLFEKFGGIIVGITGLTSLFMILLFIKGLVSMGINSANPNARAQAQSSLLFTGLATVGLGSVTLIVAFFYNAI